MDQNRVLIFYSSVGSGHRSAALAIEQALRSSCVGMQIISADVFPKSRGSSVLTESLSTLSTTLAPGIYNWLWKTGSMQWAFELSTRLPWIERRVLGLVSKFAPQVIVCTQALPCAVLARARIGPLAAAATDFQVHPYWPASGVSTYLVANEICAAQLRRRGVPAASIFPVGIPIKAGLKPRQGSSDGDFRVMVMAGGGTVGPYLPLYPAVRRLVALLSAQSLPGIRWTFVFGKSERLYRQAERLLAGRPEISLYAYVENMPDLLAQTDVIVAKPGGLILAESLACGIPVVLAQRGAGQEAANAEAVLSEGAGVLALSGDEILNTVRRLALDAPFLHQLTQRARAAGKANAANEAARLVMSLLTGGQASPRVDDIISSEG